jgi:putative porin
MMRTRRVLVLLVMMIAARPLAVAAEMSTEQRLRALEEALRNAQKEIERLRSEVQRQKADNAATRTQVEDAKKAEAERAQTTEETKKQVEEVKKTALLPDWLKRVTPFGDIRLRYEGFYNQPTKEGTKVTARNRERLRARIGVKLALADELSAAIRIATGDPNDPISTNETLTKDFTPKHVNLDWAFLTFTPGKSFNIRPGVVAFTGGKFPVPIFKPDEMVFDDDLSPEGLYETFALLDKPKGALDQVKIYALQWTFDEVSNAQDGWMIGGQINPTLHVGSAQIEAGVGEYWYLNPNLIAQDLNTNSSLKNTNEVLRNADGMITGFKSGFNLFNQSLTVTFPDAVAGMPVRLFENYVYNWQAATDDAQGVTAGVRLGDVKKRGDWSAMAFYEYLGQEAALSTFTYSDFGLGGTNQQGPVVQLQYQLLDPITITVKNHFTNFNNRPDDTSNPTLFRLQLDAMAKF